MPEFTIPTPKGPRAIGEGHPAFIVAEMSANHGRSLDRARRIVRAAADAGADAIKLQTYLPSTMTIDCGEEPFVVRDETSPGAWNRMTLFALYEQAYTPWEWHEPLRDLAHALGLVFFSTPFDATAVDFLERLDVPLYKVASYELTDLPLLARIARTGKPVVVSVGFGTLEEVGRAVDTLRGHGCRDLALLHCVTSYRGAPPDEAIRLRTIDYLGRRFAVVPGFSDNTPGTEVPIQAVAMGAAIVEKHVAAGDGAPVVDGSFSLSPDELRGLVAGIRRAERIAGSPSFGPQNDTERYFVRFRRSIFAIRDVAKGEVLSEENVRVIRPSIGLDPACWQEVLGRRAAADIRRGTPLDWALIE